MAAPPLVIDPLPPLPTPDGLFAAVGKYQGLLDLPDHGGVAGAIWTPDTSVQSELSQVICQAPPYSSFVLDAIDGLSQAWPFAVYASLVTGAVGYSEQEAARRVKQRLINYEQNAAERALWGTAAMSLFQTPGVSVFAGTVPPAAAASPGVAGGIFQQVAAGGVNAGYRGELSGGVGVGLVEAISLLEQSAADNYFGQAYIHARPRMAAYMGFRSQFKFIPVPPIEQTWNEDVIVLGNGYAGTGPAGEAPVNASDATGTEYIWATGRVIVWRDPQVWVSPPDLLLNRNTNQRGLYAFRRYMIGVEAFAACCKVIRINA